MIRLLVLLALVAAGTAARMSTVNEECNRGTSPGRCRSRIWMYSVQRGRCIRINGCLSSARFNNFESKSECQAACEGGSPRPPQGFIQVQRGGVRAGGNRRDPDSLPHQCRHPAERGMCRGRILQWFYNAEEGQCERFAWGGCGGNDNRFQTEMSCRHICDRSLADRCLMAAEAGMCRGRIEVWYYNAQAAECQIFYWGGCGGNENKFQTESDCNRACGASSIQT